MSAKKLCISLAASVIIIAGLFTAGTGLSLAEERGSSSDIMKKLDEIIAEQKSIREELKAIKEELNIIKIRITQNQ